MEEELCKMFWSKRAKFKGNFRKKLMNRRAKHKRKLWGKKAKL